MIIKGKEVIIKEYTKTRKIIGKEKLIKNKRVI